MTQERSEQIIRERYVTGRSGRPPFFKNPDVEFLLTELSSLRGRVEQVEKALRWYDDHKTLVGNYDGSLFGDLSTRAALESRP